MRRGLIVVVLLVSLAPVCRAQEWQLWEELGVDELARAGEQYGAGVELTGELKFEHEVKAMLERAVGVLPDVLRVGLRSSLALLSVVMLCAMAEGIRAAGIEQSSLNVCTLAGTLAITAVSANDMSSMMGLGRSTIDSMQGFSQVLLPVVAGCTAAVGTPVSAAARQVATALFSGILIRLIDCLLVPMVYAYVAVCAAYAAVGNPGLKRLAGMLKWVVTRSLSGLLILFVTYLTVSGAIAGTTDAAALKAAKAAISTVIPVVGGIISNAAETILVGAGLLKSTVGLFGLLAVLGICLLPFLRLGAHYVCYKAGGVLAMLLADSRLGELIDGIGTAFALILAMTGASALLLLVSMISAVAGVGI